MKPEELRRLLELAAKAAGMNDWQWREESQALAHYNTAMACFYCDHAGDAITWNPADDDGDSRRLEVKLQATVLIGPSADWVKIGHSVNVCEGYTEDPYAATRLAVLRAGAVVGEAMP